VTLSCDEKEVGYSSFFSSHVIGTYDWFVGKKVATTGYMSFVRIVGMPFVIPFTVRNDMP
jgi:hypothetical protein